MSPSARDAPHTRDAAAGDRSRSHTPRARSPPRFEVTNITEAKLP